MKHTRHYTLMCWLFICATAFAQYTVTVKPKETAKLTAAKPH